MKNLLYIDITTGCECKLLCSVDDGSEKVILHVTSNLAKNPKMEILNGDTINITTNPWEYEIPSASLTGKETESLNFRFADDAHSGQYFKISKIPSMDKTLTLQETGTMTYKLTIATAAGDGGLDDLKTTVNNLNTKVTQMQSDLTDLQGDVETLDNARSTLETKVGNLTTTVNGLPGKMFPVGAIYISANNVNPSGFLGGTWVAWGTGRVPVGVDTSQTEFSTTEKTGGAKTVTLTTDQMPSHTHTQTAHSHAPGTRDGFLTYVKSTITRAKVALTSGTRYAVVETAASSEATDRGLNWDTTTSSVTATNQNTGGGKAHNNLQPYITCYMWKRTK